MPSRLERALRYHGRMATAVISPASTERSSQAPACVRLGFRLGDAVLGLDVADEAAQHLIEDAYAPLQCPPAGASSRASLRRLGDGRLHVRYGRQILRLASAADPVSLRAEYHAAREIFARFASERRETIAVYGALCAIDGGAVLLLGPTTIGKTLLALHLAAAGALFLGDETAVISPKNSETRAMPRRPTLRESALPLLPHEAMAQAVASSPRFFSTERGRFWYALDAAALHGIEPSARPYPLRAVCVLRERGERESIVRIDSAQGLKVLAQRAYVRPTSLAQLAALHAATRRAAFFDVTVGTPESTSAALMREVRACE